MRRLKIRNFILDPRNRKPLLVVETVTRGRGLPLPLDLTDVPRILSALYRVRRNGQDLHHALGTLFKQMGTARMRRLVLRADKDGGVRGELHYTLLFGLVRRRLPLSLADTVILHLVHRLPLFADGSLLRGGRDKDTPDKPLHGIYPRDLLERWDPGSKNTTVH